MNDLSLYYSISVSFYIFWIIGHSTLLSIQQSILPWNFNNALESLKQKSTQVNMQPSAIGILAIIT